MGIIDLFIQKEDPKTGSQEKQVEEAPKPVSTQSFTPAESVATIGTDDAIIGRVWDSIIQRNLPGPDYLELKNNAAALEGLPLSEEQRLEASFKVLKKSYPTFTKDVVLRSVDTYINIVNEEKELGLKEVEQLEKETVGEKTTRLSQLRETANDILKQMDELKKRYEETNASANALDHEILTETQKISSQKQKFISSIESVISTLQSDKVKISTLNFQ